MTGWVVIPGWPKFQHYRDRHAPWLKDYVDQLDRDSYRDLSLSARGLLRDLRLLTLRFDGVVNSKTVPGLIGTRVPTKLWKELSNAGLIQIVASKPASTTASPSRAPARSRETEVEREPPKPPVNGGPVKLTAKELRRYTGCAYKRGSHGATYVHEILGTDKPPADWPHPKPTRAEIELHLEIADR